jgi:hypothetical protein
LQKPPALKAELRPLPEHAPIRLLADEPDCTVMFIRVIATAELIEIAGRRLVFRVSARDSRQVIGEGTHERAVVSLERFLARLAGSST